MLERLRNLRQKKEFILHLLNSMWMMMEQVLRIFSGVFVGIYVARKIGPEQFGHLSYALALVIVLMVVSRLGMDSILVRDMVGTTDKRKSYMGTGFGMMQLASLVSFVGLGLFTIFFEPDPLTQACLWIISVELLFQGFYVIDYSFQSDVQAKYSAMAKSLALVGSAGFKVYLAWAGIELKWIAWAYVSEFALVGFFLLAIHHLKGRGGFVFHFDFTLVKTLLKSAWPMVLAGLSGVLYMRVDQIMVAKMLGTEQLGLYAAATRIYEGWIILPYVLSLSLLPAIVKLRAGTAASYEGYLSKIMAGLFFAGAVVAVAVELGGDWLILISFGPAYTETFPALSVLILGAPLYAFNAISARYLTAESQEKKIALRTSVGLVVNLILNFLLIPQYGIQGAAIATLITMLIADYLINYLDKELRPLVRICNHAVTLQFLWKRAPVETPKG